MEGLVKNERKRLEDAFSGQKADQFKARFLVPLQIEMSLLNGVIDDLLGLD